MIDTSRKNQIEQFVQSLTYDEVHMLYHQLGDQLRLVQRARDLAAFQEFHILDRVTFDHQEQRITGTILRINQRTVSIQSSDGLHWKVSPTLLQKEQPNDTNPYTDQDEDEPDLMELAEIASMVVSRSSAQLFTSSRSKHMRKKKLKRKHKKP